MSSRSGISIDSLVSGTIQRDSKNGSLETGQLRWRRSRRAKLRIRVRRPKSLARTACSSPLSTGAMDELSRTAGRRMSEPESGRLGRDAPGERTGKRGGSGKGRKGFQRERNRRFRFLWAAAMFNATLYGSTDLQAAKYISSV
jgi:hypothetical protein